MERSIAPALHEHACHMRRPSATCHMPPTDANRWAFNMPRDNSFSYSYYKKSTTDDLLQLLRDNKCQMQNTHTLCSTSPSLALWLRCVRNHSYSHHSYKDNICASCFFFFVLPLFPAATNHAANSALS